MSDQFSKKENAGEYVDQGIAWDMKNEFDKAIKAYNKAIELKPDLAGAYLNRGISWRKKGACDRAIEDFDKAVELAPDLAIAYNNRGVTWIEKRDYDRAIKDFDKALELNPSDLAISPRGSARLDQLKTAGPPEIQPYTLACHVIIPACQ